MIIFQTSYTTFD